MGPRACFLRRRHRCAGNKIAFVFRKKTIQDKLEQLAPNLPWGQIEFNFLDLRTVFRFRKFAQCIHSKIWTGGIEIWLAPEEVRAENLFFVGDADLSAADARDDWVHGYVRKAFSLLTLGRKCKDSQAQNAYTGACFSLWALLYDAGIDPSPIEFRWRIGRLLKVAGWIDPEFGKLKPLLNALPERFYRGNLNLEKNIETEARMALAAGWRIHRAAKRAIARRDGVPAAKKWNDSDDS
jgi:hypothetical protein